MIQCLFKTWHMYDGSASLPPSLSPLCAFCGCKLIPLHFTSLSLLDLKSQDCVSTRKEDLLITVALTFSIIVLKHHKIL